jgi:spermidine synthase
MIPWETLDAAEARDGGVLRLMRRGGEFSIRLEGGELMNSRSSGSETALATLSFELLAGRRAPRVLIGGLGMGFTLRAAQAAAAPNARLVVAELAPEVVRWARGPMAELFGDSLSDPRVELRVADVREIVHERPAAFDAILLDVDNGPAGLTRPANDALYDERGLGEARRALRPEGVLAVWSAAPDAAFTRRLAGCGFDVTARTVRGGRNRRGPRHMIWLARAPSSGRG